ncbi:MAG: aminodeoxychorismate/anthranilate synthase component II [Planctomycetales bacterium]|nr:aminodeoxychorismate/anthranilate synthase component II [Planctomycetales bacterium]
MILLIDNYDSFVYNLKRYLVRLGQVVTVLRNDDSTIDSSISHGCQAIIISPGPRDPDDAGSCIQVVQKWSGRLPILGVCLGHQVIAKAFGGRVVRAKKPLHGCSTPIQLSDHPLFQHLPSTTEFARYHSLVAERESLPDSLAVIAQSGENEIMAVGHKLHMTFGVQFHPESVLSPFGYQLVHNFLGMAGLNPPAAIPESDISRIDFSLVPDWEAPDLDGISEPAVALPYQHLRGISSWD